MRYLQARIDRIAEKIGAEIPEFVIILPETDEETVKQAIERKAELIIIIGVSGAGVKTCNPFIQKYRFPESESLRAKLKERLLRYKQSADAAC